jgi:spore coat protein SA
MERILATVERLGLAGCVDFLGKVPHEEMPRIYHESDVLVFPSLRDEGLPLAMVEAMLAGCAVITTGSGGAMEVASLAALPLFPKNDFAALGELLNRSVCDQNWLKETARRGQRVALQAFTSERMMQKIEAMLLRVTELYPRSTSKVAGSTSQALV